MEELETPAEHPEPSTFARTLQNLVNGHQELPHSELEKTSVVSDDDVRSQHSKSTTVSALSALTGLSTKSLQMKQIRKAKAEKKKLRENRLKKIARENNALLKIDDEDVEQERELRRIATKGVITLFNAIKKYQRRRSDHHPRFSANAIKRQKIDNHSGSQDTE